MSGADVFVPARVPVLETERLRMRGFALADLDHYAALSADPEVVRFLGNSKVLTRAEAGRALATIVGHWQLYGHGLWAVENRASGRFVGRVGFIHFEGWPDFELGWTLARAEWGRGYATEAGREALRYAFEVLERPHVISLIVPENTRSVAVAERLGERRVGEETLGGKVADLYRVTREEWSAANGSR